MADSQSFLSAISAVIAKTNTYTITVAECNGRITFTNEGTTVDVFAYYLPTAIAGQRAGFIVADAKILQVHAASGDTIRIGATEGEIIHTNTAGDTVELICINDTEWIGLGQSGQFSVLSAKGFKMGGFDADGYQVDVEEIVFSTEAVAKITGELDTAASGGAGVNSGTKGFKMGGFNTGGRQVDVEEIVFSTEAVAKITGELNTAADIGAGVNSGTKGFKMGGIDAGGRQADVEEIVFSTEAVAKITGELDTAANIGAGVNSGVML